MSYNSCCTKICHNSLKSVLHKFLLFEIVLKSTILLQSMKFLRYKKIELNQNHSNRKITVFTHSKKSITKIARSSTQQHPPKHGASYKSRGSPKEDTRTFPFFVRVQLEAGCWSWPNPLINLDNNTSRSPRAEDLRTSPRWRRPRSWFWGPRSRAR